MLRCTQTADILFPDTDGEIMDELRECDLGEFDGKSISELKDNESFLGWLEGKIRRPAARPTKSSARALPVPLTT